MLTIQTVGQFRKYSRHSNAILQTLSELTLRRVPYGKVDLVITHVAGQESYLDFIRKQEGQVPGFHVNDRVAEPFEAS